MVTFNRRTNTSDEKFLSGDKVHKGTLGPNRERDGFDAFQAKLRSENPRYEDFYSGSRTFNEVANMSQMKIDQAASSLLIVYYTIALLTEIDIIDINIPITIKFKLDQIGQIDRCKIG